MKQPASPASPTLYLWEEKQSGKSFSICIRQGDDGKYYMHISNRAHGNSGRRYSRLFNGKEVNTGWETLPDAERALRLHAIPRGWKWVR